MLRIDSSKKRSPKVTLASTARDRRHLIVSAPRGSGGCIAHLSNVIPRLRRLRPDWNIELHGSGPVLDRSFGPKREPWMYELRDDRYRSRLSWEFLELPALCKTYPSALIYAPFGPLLNISCAPRAVFMPRNVIALIDPATREISEGDRVRATLLRTAFVLNARGAKRVICVSNHARDLLAALSGVPKEQLDVVPHGGFGGDPDRICTDSVAESLRLSKYLLHMGQPVPYRRTRQLIDGYAVLIKRRPETPRLVIVGTPRPVDQWYADECRRAAEPLIREGRIIMLPQISHADSLTLTARAAAIVYPSVHEDCPNVILEALAAGRALVCADIPAMRELAADAAVYLDNPDAAKIANGIERVLTDTTLREHLEVSARERGKLFSWDQTAERTALALDSAFEPL